MFYKSVLLTKFGRDFGELGGVLSYNLNIRTNNRNVGGEMSIKEVLDDKELVIHYTSAGIYQGKNKEGNHVVKLINKRTAKETHVLDDYQFAAWTACHACIPTHEEYIKEAKLLWEGIKNREHYRTPDDAISKIIKRGLAVYTVDDMAHVGRGQTLCASHLFCLPFLYGTKTDKIGLKAYAIINSLKLKSLTINERSLLDYVKKNPQERNVYDYIQRGRYVGVDGFKTYEIIGEAVEHLAMKSLLLPIGFQSKVKYEPILSYLERYETEEYEQHRDEIYLDIGGDQLC